MSALNALISLLIASCSYFGKTHCPGYAVPLARFWGYFINQGSVIVGSVFGVYGECIVYCIIISCIVYCSIVSEV